MRFRNDMPGAWGRAVARVAIVAVLGGCSFKSPTGGDDDDGDDVGPGEKLVPLEENAFAGTLVDGLVAKRGVLEPDAFATGGLHAVAYTPNKIADQSTYASVIASLGTAVGAGYRQTLVDWQFGRPHGLGLVSDDQFTIAYDGEIQMTAGTHNIMIEADDRAIVQMAGDGVTFGPDMFTHNQNKSFSLTVDHAGWIPIRAVVGEEGGSAKLVIRVDGTVVDGSQMRSRNGKAAGLIAYLFTNQGLSASAGESVVATVDETYTSNLPPPYDGIGMQPTNLLTKWGVRFAGQLLIDADGDYTFTVDKGSAADDGFRLWLDGKVIAAHWNELTDKLVSDAVTLGVGWHEVLVDYAQNDGSAEVHLKMAAGSGASVVIDSDHLRPAVVFGRTAGFLDGALTGTGLADNATTTISMPVTAPAQTVIDNVDVGYALANVVTTTMTETLDLGGGVTVAVPSDASTGPLVVNYFPSLGHVGDPMPTTAAPWKLVFTDDTAGGPFGPAAVGSMVSFLYHGGSDAPLATTWSYTSPALATPMAKRLAHAHLTADARGATFVISVRTADSDTAIDGATWVDVAEGDVPSTMSGEFLQYRVVVTSDGWTVPSISKVVFDYVAPDN